MKRSLVLATLLVAAAGCTPSPSPPPDPGPAPPPPAVPALGTGPRPNIVLVMADDLGYGDLRCYHAGSKIPTPNLDRLAAQGVRCTDAHSPSAVCSPTRYGLLTGRYAWRTWLRASVLLEWDPPLIEAGRLTLAEMLRQHGYRTACIGKWHLGWSWPITRGRPPHRGGDRDPAAVAVDFGRAIADGPTTRGFDTYFGHDAPNFPPYCFIEDDRVVTLPSVRKPEDMFGVAGPMAPGWRPAAELPALRARALRTLAAWGRGGRERPFFLYLPLSAPHTPIAPAAAFVGKSAAGAYGDFVAQIDDLVGAVMAALEEQGIADDTLLVFTSDNGSPGRSGIEMCGSLGSVTHIHGHDPNAPLRGRKGDIHEGGHRVPFLARWPGVIAPGTTTDETICHVDLMATLAIGVLGAKLPADAAEDSYDVMPALRGDALAAPLREATVLHSYDGMFAVRKGPWKLVLGLGSGGWTPPARVEPGPGEPPGQLYDLAADPGERHNVFAANPDVVGELVALLRRYDRDGRSAPPR